MDNKEKQRADQCMREHSYAIDIEETLVKVLELDPLSMEDKRDVYNLQISADNISHNPFLHIKCGLFYYLALHPDKREAVKKYISDYCFVSHMSMSDILSFVDEEDMIDSYTLEENGEKYVNRMIADFDKIVLAK
ncbi:MAG: hypothetical protein OSJ72_11640 [Lachnospiraceae bacterium]|nr:hypothetical protein [Lachnospiraceae bacterium]